MRGRVRIEPALRISTRLALPSANVIPEPNKPNLPDERVKRAWGSTQAEWKFGTAGWTWSYDVPRKEEVEVVRIAGNQLSRESRFRLW